MKFFYLLIVLPCFLVPLSASARADQILLRNGDTLSCTILKKEGDTLVVKTGYAGKIEIRWQEVASLAADTPKLFVLKDGVEIKGTTAIMQPGGIQVTPEGTTRPTVIAVADIAFIDPAPYLLGKGTKFSGHVNLGASLTEGNSETETQYFDGEIVGRTKADRFTVSGLVKRSVDSDVETEFNMIGTLKYDYFLTKKWYVFSNALFEDDRFKDLNLRSTMGGGGGYQFRESDMSNLYAELGINYIKEDFIEAGDNDYPAWRWSFKLNQAFLEGKVLFFHVHEVFGSVKHGEDLFLRSQTGFRLPLIRKLNATVQANVDWDNTPAEDKARKDATYLLTLGYVW